MYELWIKSWVQRSWIQIPLKLQNFFWSFFATALVASQLWRSLSLLSNSVRHTVQHCWIRQWWMIYPVQWVHLVRVLGIWDVHFSNLAMMRKIPSQNHSFDYFNNKLILFSVDRSDSPSLGMMCLTKDHCLVTRNLVSTLSN